MNGKLEPVQLETVIGDLPSGFEVLRSDARGEGYRHIERLAGDWGAGTLRFSLPGEVLLAARCDGELVGIGGLTHDRSGSGMLRMRRFYVRPASRRLGVGRILAECLVRRARRLGCTVAANAAPGSEPFWEALGFVREACDDHTHALR
ncbi:MAG TPA: GNAT family N-acetyltransferase [Stellaceae bacterium]|nr:GNAT family N-acetyltransferase [Stellaceae bacterium]